MGFWPVHTDDPSHPGYTFKCAGCGCQRAVRVVVRDRQANPYRTEFARCGQCWALFHWPLALPSEEPMDDRDTRERKRLARQLRR